MSVTNGYQYGGIYCVIPIGKLYDERIANSVRRRLRSYLGVTADEFRTQNLNNLIRDTINSRILEEMRELKYANFDEIVAKNVDSDSADALEAIKDQITQSYGFAIYHNGRRVSYSPAPFSETSKGRKRVKDFFDENKNKFPNIGSVNGGNINNWQIVLAVAHYAAARFEATGAYPDNMYKGYGKRVLLMWAQVIANIIRSSFGRKNQPVQYGYILSRRGYEGQVLRGSEIATN